VIVARRFVVAGRVQGVGFRYFVADAAGHERLGGWVRNLRDGRVEALVEGEAQAVDRFEARIRSGPPAARVDNVVVEEREPSGRATAFRVEPSA
jgi:acylphosphatase